MSSKEDLTIAKLGGTVYLENNKEALDTLKLLEEEELIKMGHNSGHFINGVLTYNLDILAVEPVSLSIDGRVYDLNPVQEILLKIDVT